MPKESYYSGLTLVEQLRKFIDYHSDKKYRHISGYEAQMLDVARARLDLTVAVARRQLEDEIVDVRRLLSQYYETVLFDEEIAIGVLSIPAKGDSISPLVEIGLSELANNPTPPQVQAAITALVDSRSGNNESFRSLYESFLSDSRQLEDEANVPHLAAINRVLYLPSVVAENSWADVAPLLEHLSRANQRGAPVLLFSGVMMATGNLVVAILAGGSVIGFQMLQHVADGMAPGLKALGEKLIGANDGNSEVADDEPADEPSDGT